MPGTRRKVNPVGTSGAASLLRVSLTESTRRSRHVRWFGSGAPACLRFSLGKGPDAQGVSGGVGPVTPCVCRPLYARDRCAPDASGANLSTFGGSFLTIGDQRTWFKELTRGC